MKLIKLSEYAKSTGMTYQTVHSWFKQGILNHKTRRTPKGGILVEIPESTDAEELINNIAEKMEKVTVAD